MRKSDLRRLRDLIEGEEGPGDCLANIQDCRPYDQDYYESAVVNTLRGASLMADAAGLTGGKAGILDAVTDRYFSRREESQDRALSFGLAAARVIGDVGEAWAEAITTCEGQKLSRIEMLVWAAESLEQDGFDLPLIMMALETIAQLHAHHSRTGANVLLTADMLKEVFPSFSIDQHSTTCAFFPPDEDYQLYHALADMDREGSPHAYLALLHWNLLRAEDMLQQNSIEYHLPKELKGIRKELGVDQFIRMSNGIYEDIDVECEPLPAILTVDSLFLYEATELALQPSVKAANALINSVKGFTHPTQHNPDGDI